MKRNITDTLLIFVGFTLLNYAKIGTDSPLALGLFSALCYIGFNPLLLSPTYLLSAFLVSPNLYTLAVSVAPTLVFFFAGLLHKRFNSKMKIVHITIYSFVALIPTIFVSAESYVGFFRTAVIGTAFSYCAVVSLYAVVVRGKGYRLQTDETVCTAVLLSALSYGVFSLKVSGFTLYYPLMSFAILFLSFLSNDTVGYALAVGLGGGSIESVATAVCLYVASLVFKRHHRLLSSGAVILTQLMITSLTGGDMLGAIGVMAGAVAFALIPPKKLAVMLSSLGNLGEDCVTRLLVTRNRADVAGRLSGIAYAYFSASSLIAESDKAIDKDEMRRALIAELESEYCDGCPGKAGCHKLLGGGIEEVLSGVVDSALKNGKATVLDLPPYLTGSCARVNRLIDTVNVLAEKYRGKMTVKANAGATKKVLATLTAGMGKMMEEIRDSLRVSSQFDWDRERNIADNLNGVSITCTECAVYGEGCSEKVCLIVREGEEERPIIPKVVSKTLGRDMTVFSSGTVGEGRSEVWLSPTPKYDVVIGRKTVAKEKDNGDSYSITRLPDGKILLAISDGMGSGRSASENSTGVVGIVESFLRAGFSAESVIPVLNGLMTLSGGEKFQTLDLAVINPTSGNVCVIKLGAPESVVKRDGVAQVVSGSALPVGILDEVRPYSTVLNLEENDVFVMYSDGIADAVGVEKVGRLLEESSVNPQVLAEKLVGESVLCARKDDATVIVARLFRRV